jgi:ferredoxin/coenzyme F420-reducing hydrogenase delta subunit
MARSSPPDRDGAAMTAHAAAAVACRGLRRVERAFDGAFGAEVNPWRQLGALAVFFLVVLAGSGVYLYAVLDTSAAEAWRSIDRLPAFGAVLRSVHRYAADGLAIVLALHVLREALLGRFRAFRRYTWLTGVPLLPLAGACAIVGFWLNWDVLGQYSATSTAQWLDGWPLFASPLTRNLLAGGVSDRLFSLFVFVHLGVPLLLVFGLWFHVQRLARPMVWPPRALAAGSAAMLLALALAAPVTSHAPADLARVPRELAVDWWLLFVHPLTDATSPSATWALVLGALGLLFALPWWPGPARAPAAEVVPARCNGCRRCFDDCPYAAVTMVRHVHRPEREMARVDPDLCAACGICVGACPSSTPMRRAHRLTSAIELPQLRIDTLRTRLREGLAAAQGAVVVFACERAARPDAAHAVVLPLPCIGMLSPSFVEHALREGAGRVVIAGCAGCEFRFGRRWTEQRIAGTRAPALRRSVPRRRIELAWADPGDEPGLRRVMETQR